jgi:hypothetical protein
MDPCACRPSAAAAALIKQTRPGLRLERAAVATAASHQAGVSSLAAVRKHWLAWASGVHGASSSMLGELG